jgi:hypothetical protein
MIGKMKRLIVFCIGVLLASSLAAQSWGMSAHALGFFLNKPYAPETIRPSSPFSPGIRVEGNYIVPGFTFPISGFNGLGISYYLPYQDSVVILAPLKRGGYDLFIPGVQSTTAYNLDLRFAYEIPQTFNDFLMLHAGWGFDVALLRYHYVFPDKSTSYTPDDFKEGTFDTYSSIGFEGEIFVGAVYELEKFSLVGQYIVCPGVNSMTQKFIFRHGLSAGIYYPLKKL